MLQLEAKGAHMAPQGPPKCLKNAKVYPKRAQLEAQGAAMESQGHLGATKTPQGSTNCRYETKMCPKVPKNNQAHPDTSNHQTK